MVGDYVYSLPRFLVGVLGHVMPPIKYRMLECEFL
jgi:hypothetical protein